MKVLTNNKEIRLNIQKLKGETDNTHSPEETLKNYE